MLYFISYDINEQVYDYSELKEKIKSLGEFQHPMDSLWFVKTNEYDADSIYNSLSSYLHDKDHILVMNVDPEGDRQGWLPKSFWKWIRNQ